MDAGDAAAGSLTVGLTQDHRYRDTALAVPGAYWSRERLQYEVTDPDARAAAAAITLFPETLTTYPQLQALRDAAYGNARPHNFADELGIRLDVGQLGDKQLYDWQDTDAGYLAAILNRDGGVQVGWDRGLGKTVISAAFIQKLGARRTLIVARNDAKEAVWLKELTAVLPDHNIWVLPDSTQPTKQRKTLASIEAMSKIHSSYEKPLVLIIHYQAIRTIAGDKVVNHQDGTTSTSKGRGTGWDRLGNWDLMVYDESHRLANYNPNSGKNTQEGRALSTLRSRHVKHAINLSGSGIMNRPDDLFGQLHLILPGTYRSKWADWNDRFVDYVKTNNRKTAIGWKIDKLPELRKELGVFMVYRKKEEVFDLPPLIYQPIELALLPEQRRVYNEMRDEFWSMYEGGGIKALSAMDQMNKLRQIATGYPGVPSSKLDYVVNDVMEDEDNQYAVFTWYKRPGHILAERLGDMARVVDGDVSKRERRTRLADHEAGKFRVLIGSIATIGESLNLQYMHEAFRLDRSWNPGDNDQTVDRLNRNGQVTRVTFRDLWALDTVDTLKVKPNLSSKESIRKAVFG